MNEASPPLEEGIALLLADLSAVQTEMLGVLRDKCQRLVSQDVGQIKALQPAEQALIERLTAIQARREALLAQAEQRGLPAESLKAVAGALPDPPRRGLKKSVDAARSQARLLQHQSLTNWVLAQRTLLHLSQLLEIVATGGKPRPTYGRKEPLSATSGALMDRAV
ncbi:FlgN protein [Pirellulimonas nuda]|uniref:FlgN protein n=1 Tax=Pirellulimonas nuda TaxID=2528009 RepID=A0A518DFS4_9BACT|nr:flagellar export chaperone FlgN [Pirellulimonas nuda]QDU90316.1 FlgN protein [Pirellulimonas nuda]